MPMKFSADNIAVIPARGGSKGIPSKALQMLGGETLLSRTVRQSLAASSVTRTIVSTDSEAYAAHARECGAEVPFLRPASMASDSSPVTDAIIHLLDFLNEKEGAFPENILLLQPTSPLRLVSDIDSAYLLLKEPADSVVSVCDSEVRLSWLKELAQDGFLAPLPFFSGEQHAPRQASAPLYRLNGAVYWIKTSVFLQRKIFITGNSLPWIMPHERSVDIDSPFDLEFAKFLLENK